MTPERLAELEHYARLRSAPAHQDAEAIRALLAHITTLTVERDHEHAMRLNALRDGQDSYDKLVVAEAERDAAMAEKDNWVETASQFHRNEFYYRGLVEKCGEAIGEAAYTQDDGGKVDAPLCVKVPELVSALVRERDALAKGDAYARRLFTTIAPQCTLLDSPEGVMTQIDNVTAGLTAERDALRAALIPQACFDHSTSEKIHIDAQAARIAELGRERDELHWHACNSMESARLAEQRAEAAEARDQPKAAP